MSVPLSKRLPVDHMDHKALFAELLEDVVLLTPTPLPRFMAAINKIAKSRGISAEQAFTDLKQAKLDLTGNSHFPIG